MGELQSTARETESWWITKGLVGKYYYHDFCRTLDPMSSIHRYDVSATIDETGDVDVRIDYRPKGNVIEYRTRLSEEMPDGSVWFIPQEENAEKDEDSKQEPKPRRLQFRTRELSSYHGTIHLESIHGAKETTGRDRLLYVGANSQPYPLTFQGFHYYLAKENEEPVETEPVSEEMPVAEEKPEKSAAELLKEAGRDTFLDIDGTGVFGYEMTGSKVLHLHGPMYDYRTPVSFRMTYDYEIVDNDLLQANCGGVVPRDTMEKLLAGYLLLTLRKLYPDGITYEELAKPSEDIVPHMYALAADRWLHDWGLRLTDLSLGRFGIGRKREED